MGLPWPATVLSGLGVFTLCMWGVALTIPPAVDESTRGIRTARVAVLLIGLIGGGAGLAGALATPGMTIFTFGGAVIVGLVAALWGKTQRARILGWLGGALAAQLLVLCVSLRVGAAPEWAAFAVLAVGAALIASVVLLPRFAKEEALPEASAIEWAGYAAGVIAVALSSRSAFNVAAILIGWGCILSMAAIRAGRPEQQQRLLFYVAGGSALIAVWLLRFNSDLAHGPLPEGLTLPFAILAFVVGLHQLQQRPELGSWAAYGPALIAAFAPSISLIIVKDPDPLRIVALLAGGITVLIWGSVKQQRAPLAIGSAVTTIVAFDALITAGQIWLAIGIAGIVVLAIGATEEGRRRSMGRYNRSR
jgi:MFS family permease